MMKISLIHPSRGRFMEAGKTMSKWIANADVFPEYIVMVDNDDKISIDGYRTIIGNHLHLSDNKSAIEAINNAAKIATGDLLIVVSDDFDCPQHWDTLLLEALQGKEDFCVKTQDGLQKALMTLPIMDRTYYNRFGYIYHPAYKHMFSDQEMTAVAHMLGRAIELPILFPHNHYTTGKFAKDAISLKNDATWSQGQSLFDTRLKRNFDIHNPVIPYTDIVWK